MLELKLKELEAEIRKEMKAQNEAISVADKKLCDIRHFIELEKYSASEGAKLLKQQRLLLQERRVAKEKHEELYFDLTRIQGLKLPKRKSINKNYYFRSNIVENTIGRQGDKI